jgi:hypothetical protein
MKTPIITAIILSSLIFFNGCSSTSPAPENREVSVYNIMGIKGPTKSGSFFVVKDDNSPQYGFKINGKVKYYNSSSDSESRESLAKVSDNIEIVSYAQYRPKDYIDKKRLIAKIERDAKRFLGTKYVWGATGPTKFDCSGFTQWVYRDAGINIPRVSRDQARVGEYVNFEDLKKGDMIFFDTKKRKQGIVTHVGIYLGNGDFIHASSVAKQVIVYNFYDKPYYKERFLWGRRVVQDKPYYASNY